MRRFLLVLGASLLAAASASAQNRAGVAARVFQKDHSGSVAVVLVDRRGDTLVARMGEAQAGSITFEAGQVTGIAFELSEAEIRQAEVLAAAGRGGDAVKGLRPLIRPLLPYLDLPVGRAGDAVLTYGRLLRGEKNWSEAIHVYRALVDNPDDGLRGEAAGWLAYSTVRNRQLEEADAWLAGAAGTDDPRAPGFGPWALAAAWRQAEAGDQELALDHAARAAALLPLGHELHAEALWLSGRAYQALGDDLAASTNRPPPGRELVLGRADALPPPPAPMTAEEFHAVASNVYSRLARLFPATGHGTAARAELDRLYPLEPSPGETP
jgi:tetratricopeptide (TPR) repeat protein